MFLVLAYHNIIKSEEYFNSRLFISTREFKEHLKIILNLNYKIWLNEKSNIIITFDDWYKNFLEIYPFLKKNNIKVIMFISVNKIWKKIYEEDYKEEKEYLSMKDILKLKKTWLVKFYNHWYNHINFLENNFNLTKKDILFSDNFFKSNNFSCKHFCFPYWTFKNSDVNFLLKLWYKKLYTTKSWFNFRNDFLIKRYAPRNLLELKNILEKYEKNK